MINSGMQDYLNIGFVEGSVHKKASELPEILGVQYRFYPAYYKELKSHYNEALQDIQNNLSEFLVKDNPDFFYLPLGKAVAIVDKIVSDYQNSESVVMQKLLREKSLQDRDAKMRQNLLAAKNLSQENYKYENNDFRQAGKGKFQLVQSNIVKCEECSELYQVTFKRYEQMAICPNCNQRNDVQLAWG